MARRPPMAKPMTKEKDQHQRAADGHTDDHHKGHLHVDDIVVIRVTKAGDRELVDVFKRIILNA